MPPAEIHWKHEPLEETDSTNRIAAARIMERWNAGGTAEGVVITATRQSAGRGQHGRAWESPDGGLYLSAVVENVPGSLRHCLALVAGLAVVEALTEQLRPRIRWPNDIMLDTPAGPRKLAGILCESLAQGDRWAAIIGIGVNVMTREFPSPLQHIATSLWQHDHRNRSLPETANNILNRLTHWLPRLHTEGLQPIVERVRNHDDLHGKHLRFHNGDEEFDATARGIDDQGRLLLARPNHPLQPHSRGTILRVYSSP